MHIFKYAKIIYYLAAGLNEKKRVSGFTEVIVQALFSCELKF